MILDYPGGSNVIIRVLIRGRQEGQSQKGCEDGSRERERLEDAVLLALKMEEGATN